MAKQYSAPPPMTIDPKKSYDATITTAWGTSWCTSWPGAPR